MKNSEKDFWYDLSDIDGAKKLGVEKKDIYSSMEKSAIARKYQEIYAGLDNADITDYDFSGGRYEKLLEKNNYKIKEKCGKESIWETLLLITRKKILCQQKLEEMTLAGVAAERNIRPVMRHLI